MSIQWTLIAGVMYAELAVTILLLIPLISPQRWHSIFKSKFLRSVGNMSNIYFKVFLGVLCLFFVDAIREMRKYGYELSDHSAQHQTHHLDAEMQAHMRLFRAQRNFYISGFSLFLWIVLQRLASLLSHLAISMADADAALKQAKSASDAAAALMKEGNTKGEKEEECNDTEVKKLQEENHRLNAEYKAALKQAESVITEYDRLLKEHSILQDKLKIATGDESSKKTE